MANDLALPYQKKTEKLLTELEKVKAYFPDSFSSEEKSIRQYSGFVSNPELQVALVGAVKAGKSTLMNAILGDDIAHWDVTPETAALSIFKYAEKNYVKVSFYSKAEWKDLWNSALKHPESPFLKEYNALNGDGKKNELLGHPAIEEFPTSIGALKERVKEFSSKNNVAHYFVKKIEIGLSNFGSPESPLPKDICFVDTPGLHDVVAYRSEITKGYINRANAVVVCVNSSTMRDQELLTIQKTFENIGKDKSKVLILGTQLDRLNRPKEDWDKQKADWYNHLEGLYEDHSAINTNIIGVSSLIYSLVRKLQDGTEIDDNDVRDITTFAEKNGIKIVATGILEKVFSDEKQKIISKAKNILDCTNVLKFLEVLKSGPLSNPAKVLSEDLDEWYNDVSKEAKEKASVLKTRVEEQLELLNNDIASRQKAISKKQKQLDELKDSTKKINILFSEMENDITTEVSKMKEKLNSALNSVIGGR
ncbi:dynamin family protein [Treponema primitia]|uniref:dynamin family protein n=1 Tax=Treponema primitia TaxID=88058 RepID=UPI0039805224